MIFEVAEISIDKAQESEFVVACGEASGLFRQAKGCRHFQLQRVIEKPGEYRLIVGWDNVSDHMETFRQSADFQQWRALVGPFFSVPTQVYHVETLLNEF